MTMILSNEQIELLKNNKNLITEELLDTLRKTKEGKSVALQILDIPKDDEDYYLDAFGSRISFDGNRQIKPCYTKIQLSDIQIKEIQKCSEDIDYFKANYVQFKTKSGIGFPDHRKYQDDFIHALNDENDQYVVVFPRQAGKSATTAVWLTWLFLFRADISIGICANRGSTASDFLANVKNIFTLLPIWMQQGIKTWNVRRIEGENGTKILTDATSGDSFRGSSMNVIVVDECAYVRSSKWEAFSDGILPSQSALAWKKTIFISTPNGMNHFYDYYKNSKKRKVLEDLSKDEVEKVKTQEKVLNVFKNKSGNYNAEIDKPSNDMELLTVDWKEVPRYDRNNNLIDPEVFKQQVIDRQGLQFFLQAYACEFLGSSHTLISGEVLKELESSTPERQMFVNGTTEFVNIYSEAEEGHKYILSCDPAKDGRDYFALHVIDITKFPFKQVVCGKLQIDYLLMPEFIYELAITYNTAFTIIENNEGAGQSIADTLKRDFEYENLYFDRDGKGDKFKKYPGFRTTPKSRNQLLETLKLLIENNKLEINDEDTIFELQRFVLLRKKFQAEDGFHDDLVMSLAIAFCLFNDINNFEDIKKVSESIYSDNSSVDFTDIMTIGCFDDGTEINNFESDNSNNYYFGI
jgi:hypothetical protein